MQSWKGYVKAILFSCVLGVYCWWGCPLFFPSPRRRTSKRVRWLWKWNLLLFLGGRVGKSTGPLSLWTRQGPSVRVGFWFSVSWSKSAKCGIQQGECDPCGGSAPERHTLFLGWGGCVLLRFACVCCQQILLQLSPVLSKPASFSVLPIYWYDCSCYYAWRVCSG